MVCDCHYDKVADKKWHYADGYAQHSINCRVDGKKRCRTIKLHHSILEPKPGYQVDHINRNKLDNRCTNLRYATLGQNRQNIDLPKHNTSGYKGVQWRKDRSKWVAVIRIDNKLITLGTFNDKEEAAIAYNNAAIHHHGRFAVLNKVMA